MKVGREKRWDTIAFLTNIQGLLIDGKTRCERRVTDPCDCVPAYLWTVEMWYHLISIKDKTRLHQSISKFLTGVSVGYALNAEGGWTGDLLIVDAEDLKSDAATDIHAKRFKAKAVGIQKLNGEFVFSCVNGKEAEWATSSSYLLSESIVESGGG